MNTVYEAVVKPSSGGFGEYDCGEWIASDAETLAEWEEMAQEANPTATVESTDEISGCIHNERGNLYKLTWPELTGGQDEPRLQYYLVLVK